MQAVTRWCTRCKMQMKAHGVSTRGIHTACRYPTPQRGRPQGKQDESPAEIERLFQAALKVVRATPHELDLRWGSSLLRPSR